MADMAEPDIPIANRIAKLLGDAGATWSASERAEVERFLRAGEYGLALETLSWILIDGQKPVGGDTLQETESLIGIMGLGQEPFAVALRGACERQGAQVNPVL
jgi:hypothetical protein